MPFHGIFKMHDLVSPRFEHIYHPPFCSAYCVQHYQRTCTKNGFIVQRFTLAKKEVGMDTILPFWMPIFALLSFISARLSRPHLTNGLASSLSKQWHFAEYIFHFRAKKKNTKAMTILLFSVRFKACRHNAMLCICIQMQYISMWKKCAWSVEELWSTLASIVSHMVCHLPLSMLVPYGFLHIPVFADISIVEGAFSTCCTGELSRRRRRVMVRAARKDLNK